MNSGKLSAVVLIATISGATTGSWAYMDNGGRISRDLAVAGHSSETDPQKSLYFTWRQKEGGSQRLRLYSFCTDGDCSNDSTPDAVRCPAIPPGTNPCPDVENSDSLPTLDQFCTGESCRWAVELTDVKVKGNSFAPPAVSKSGDRIYVTGSLEDGGGRIYAFDPCGKCQWSYTPPESTSEGGFYARPVIHPLESGTAFDARVILAVNWDGPLYLHSFLDQDGTTPGGTYVPPIQVTSDGRSYFEPVIDPVCGNCPAGSQSCSSSTHPRVYVGVHGGEKQGLQAVDLGTGIIQWAREDANLPMRLGGVLFQTAQDNMRFMFANLENSAGSAVIEVPDDCSNGTIHAILPDISATHRSRPVKQPEGSHVNIYAGQKEDFNGSAAIHRYIPVSRDQVLGLAPQPFAPLSSWPDCLGNGTLPTTSWSSPVISPDGMIVVATNDTHPNGGIHKVDPLACMSGCGGTPTNVNAPLFSHLPPRGWRTTAAFDGDVIMAGSSKSYVYAVDANDAETLSDCESIDWCYELQDSEGGLCQLQSGTPPDCCTEPNDCP